MSQRTPASALTKTPMERIFEKVMRRKMTEEEREVLQLNVGEEHAGGKSGNGLALTFKNETKATVKRATHAIRSFSATAGTR